MDTDEDEDNSAAKKRKSRKKGKRLSPCFVPFVPLCGQPRFVLTTDEHRSYEPRAIPQVQPSALSRSSACSFESFSLARMTAMPTAGGYA